MPTQIIITFLLFFLIPSFVRPVNHVVPQISGSTTKTYALVIGISGYPNFSDSEKLKFADKDAQAFANFLTSEGGGKIPKDNIKLLVNKEATKRNIYQKFIELRSLVDNNSIFYVFFAGHGVEDSYKGAAYFMTWDSDPSLPEATGIRADDFYEQVKTISSTKGLICFIDACHAGAAISQNGRTRSTTDNVAKTFQEKFNQVISENPKGINNGLFSAASNQKALEDTDISQGIFTYYVLRGLKGEADSDQNCRVDMGELKDYVINKVSSHARSRFGKIQIPIPTQDLVPDFPLASVAAEICAKKYITLSPSESINNFKCFDEIAKIVITNSNNNIGKTYFPMILTAEIRGGSRASKVNYSWLDSNKNILGTDPLLIYNGGRKNGRQFINVVITDDRGMCHAYGKIVFEKSGKEASVLAFPPTVALSSIEVKNNTGETLEHSNNSIVCPGDSISLSANATDPDGDTLSFAWTTTGGRILGKGSYAVLDTTGLNPGEYSVTLEADDGRGNQAFDTRTVEVSNCKPLPMFCPKIDVILSSKTVKIAEPVTALVRFASGANYGTPSYSWTVSGGTIVSGMGTHSIYIDTTGISEQSVTVSVEIKGMSAQCAESFGTTTFDVVKKK